MRKCIFPLVLLILPSCGPTTPDDGLGNVFGSSSTATPQDTTDGDSASETGSISPESSDSGESSSSEGGGSSSTGEEVHYNLFVSVNLAAGSFQILSVAMGNEVVAEQAAAECPFEGFYYDCGFALPAGAYIVEFHDVARYDTPEAIGVELAEDKRVFGNYQPQ